MPGAYLAKFYGQCRSVLKIIKHFHDLNQLKVQYGGILHHSRSLKLVLAFLSILSPTLLYFVLLRISGEGTMPGRRIR